MRPSTAHRFWRSAALPFVESRCASDSAACYALHAHPTLSLGTVDGGQSVFQRGGRRRTLGKGDVVFIPAGDVHSCNPVDDGAWSYQMLYLDEVWVTRVIGELGETDTTTPCRPHTHLPTKVAHARLSEINTLLFSTASDQDKEAALLIFVGDYFAPDKTLLCKNEHNDSDAVQRVKAMIEARYHETLLLDELAAETGLSRYHLLRAFRRRIGMTPHAWQIDLRIQQARRLLNQGLPLTEVALQLGFADQSHFQRAFKQRVAATPGEYRNALRRNFVQY